MNQSLYDESLDYHSKSPKGKIGIEITKPVTNQHDLSLAYTPGIGGCCMAIQKDPEEVWRLTGRGNTVAIISDGSAVLGFGNLGPKAALPVMEGKAVLFKSFANINAFPICIENENMHSTAKALAPSFGGINLEDIKAPECFKLLEKLESELEIPVFHDDQDGTAIIILAGLKNALELLGKELKSVKIVINGAGAAGIATARLLQHAGAPKTNIYLCDSKGLVTKDRETNKYKAEFEQEGPSLSLAQTLEQADVFIGVSVANVLTQEMVKKMAKDPIVFALANPVPEIMPTEAKAAGVRIMATGRSDFENQLNNSLGFPGIFRAALDTRATAINSEMKLAAVKALAELTKEPVTGSFKLQLQKAYPNEAVLFDKENPLSENYILPKQFDPRIVPKVARAVAKAAMDSGVAQIQIHDLEAYERKLLTELHS